MSGRLKTYLQKLAGQVTSEDGIKTRFSKRAEEGALTRDENPITHFCVYFAAYDPKSQQVFIGHHKKSGLWLFNGGHIDKGEMPLEALEREVREEWGKNTQLNGNYEPSLLTITEIDNPAKQKCRLHYDIWYFIPLNKDSFAPEETLLEKEFHQTGWKTVSEARQLITDTNTLLALYEIEKLFL
ncbi:NUDIX domain-containing protein [Candidatus Parcubacteria bacterium]|nr:NUDIX domain-containing protein [Patescibacteria group bacterium]MBU4380610.1 NUDIX domain-containing protein [Patescibacteria group bacterium]MCG2689538.1 NUDIX domain-containing protein [Candidatus Parcubacteria bacterium]